MSHSVFTIVTTVRPDKEQELRDILAEIRLNPDRNPRVSFADYPVVHFASFTIFPDQDRGTLLVFENNVDGGHEAYLAALAAGALPGLSAIYGCCQEPVGGTDSAAMKRFLERHRRTPNLYHVGTPYRTAANIRADRELRRFIDVTADGLAASVSGQPAASVWEKLRAAAGAPATADRDTVGIVDWAKGHVSWVLRPEARRGPRLVNWSIFTLLGIGAIAVLTGLLHLAWPSQARLTLTLVLLFLALGAWTSVLIGWPVRRQWRHPLNIAIWFAALGWAASLIPEVARLAGLTSWLTGHTPLTSGRIAWIGSVLLAVVAVLVLAQLVGTWTLPTPDLAHPSKSNEELGVLTRQEDHDVNNHMSAMVLLRPGLYRRISLWILLWTLKWTWFQTVLRDLQKGRLFKFSTVHFAQWVMLDETRYLFLSNYDHSWSRYLDDFGFITFGLARLWGQGASSPGLGSLEHFKDFSRTWMVPYEAWYRAYPNTSVTQVWNNEKIRLGLLSTADEARSHELLERLVASEER